MEYIYGISMVITIIIIGLLVIPTNKEKEISMSKADRRLAVILEEALVDQRFKGRALNILVEFELLKHDMELDPILTDISPTVYVIDEEDK